MAELSAEVIRSFRASAGLSVTEAARELVRRSADPLPALPSIVRSWKRWEAGTHPSRAYRPLLAALVADAAGGPTGPAAVDLAGDWWSGWQSRRDGEQLVAYQPARVRQHGTDLVFWAVTRGRPLDAGGYLWRGEMRLWDNEILMGWYAADDGSVRSKGTVYFVLHPHGQAMRGRWVGLSYDGEAVTGLGVMARTKNTAMSSLRALIEQEHRGTDR